MVVVLARGRQVLGVDALHSKEHARAAGPHRLFDEARHLVALGIDLDHELQVNPALLLAQGDQAVEDRFPVLVAGQVVVGDEEPCHAAGQLGPHQSLHIVGVAEARLAPWTLMIVQKLH